MHRQITSPLPGACAICGMALEEEIGSIFTSDQPQGFQSNLQEEKRLSLRSCLICLTLLLAVYSLQTLKLSQEMATLGQFLLTTPIVFWGGSTFFKRAADSLARLTFNMYILIAMGILVPYTYSSLAFLVVFFMPESSLRQGILPLIVDREGILSIYFDSAATIVTLSLLGQYFELKARLAAGKAIESLLSLAPKVARRLEPDGSEREISLDRIAPGDLLRVRAGEQIPGDGVIANGSANINESMLTGEAIPVEKTVGDHVSAGTTNGISTFNMRITTEPEESLLAQIIRNVEASQKSKLPIQNLVDRISSVFVPVVIFIALFTFIFWSLLEHQLGLAINNSVSVLIIACPCALGLATPIAVLVASGIGAKLGILIREAKAMQILASVDCLAIDKTGTITEGAPTIKIIEAAPESNENEILFLAASLEQGSDHPLAHGILKLAQQRSIKLSKADNFDYRIGRGLTGIVANQKIVLGNQALFKEQHISYENLLPSLNRLSQKDETVLLLAAADKTIGLIAFTDKVKQTTFKALSELAKNNITVLMLTGDRLANAEFVAKQLHLNNFFADLLPADKAKIIYDYRQKGHIVAMGGDGINDAPALAQADVGIAMGNGSGIALEAADIILVKGDLLGITRAIRLSKVLMQNINQNLLLAFAYNILAIPIAAGALTPHFAISLTPAISSIAMSLSSLSVIGNALRMRLQRL